MVSKNFVTAGKAVFTVSNDQGTHYTYRITRKAASGTYAETWFVSLLTGSDNTKDYTYMGMLNPRDGSIRLTRNSKYSEDSVPVRVVRWALRIVWGSGELPFGYRIQHEGRCGRCGRLLTVPDSIDSGIGPECARMMGLVTEQPELAFA